MAKQVSKDEKSQEASEGFSEAEKAAMKERAKEIKREKTLKTKTDGEQAVLGKINEMEAGDKIIASSLHELIKQNFPQLSFKTWYGFPAYTRDGKVITFFQASKRFDERFSTLGFSADAKLDEGVFWATSYALLEWNDQVEDEIKSLIKKAVG